MNKLAVIILPALFVIFAISCKKGAGSGGAVPEGFRSAIELHDPDGAALGRVNLLATDSSGNIYVINDQDDNKAFYKYSPDGQIIKKLDGLGKDNKDYKFFFPVALSMGSDGYFFICDMGLYSVQMFNLEPERGFYITGRAKDGTKVFEPTFVTTDKKGTVYVAGPGGKIHRYNSSGQHLGEWGAKGSSAGQYTELGQYTIDSDGNFLILDREKPRLLKYGPAGKFLKEWEVGDYASSLAVDGGGSVYVCGSNWLQKFSGDGVLASELETDEDKAEFRLTAISGLPAGALALDSDNSRVLRVD